MARKQRRRKKNEQVTKKEISVDGKTKPEKRQIEIPSFTMVERETNVYQEKRTIFAVNACCHKSRVHIFSEERSSNQRIRKQILSHSSDKTDLLAQQLRLFAEIGHSVVTSISSSISLYYSSALSSSPVSLRLTHVGSLWVLFILSISCSTSGLLFFYYFSSSSWTQSIT